NLYPPHHLGGYEVACRGVMERLAERGHEVMVLTGDARLPGVDESAAEPSSAAGVEVRRELAGWWDWESFGPLRPTPPQRYRLERRTQHAVRKALDDFRPDVVSIWSLRFLSFSIATLAEERGVPIVLTLCDDWICYSHEYDGWSRVFARRPWARAVGRVVGPLVGLTTRLPSFEGATVSVASDMLAELIRSNAPWRFSPSVIRLGVETREFPVSEPPTHPWSWRLLYVGRVLAIKGVPTLLRAMASLPDDARLDVDGRASDSDRQATDALAQELGIAERVRFLCSPRSELRDRYRSADVVVFPSEWDEPFGIVPLEAMACGVPVAATGTGGSGEFLTDGVNCVRFPPGEPSSLASALRRMAADADLRARVVAGGTETTRQMNMDRYAESLEQLHLEAVLRGARGGRGQSSAGHPNADSNPARRARATGSES
ncbi:MAG TPA: glycosyltransferase family 4 protein, partial [Acidimicrobiales bacterium]|nr:glycosyltransferase family 4 protein [Acidimicrobiales bacterium]